MNACEFSHSYVSHRIFWCVRGPSCLYWSQVSASNFCFVYYPSYEGSTEKNLQWLPIFWYPTVSLFLCSLSWVWWFFLLLMDYFDKLLLTAPLKNYRNMFSLPYISFFFPKSVLLWKLKSLGGSQSKDFELGVIKSPWPHVSISYSKQKPS